MTVQPISSPDEPALATSRGCSLPPEASIFTVLVGMVLGTGCWTSGLIWP